MPQPDLLAEDNKLNLKAYSRLPGSFRELVGREREVATLQTMLEQPTTRLLTLTGPGGVGKTCLALRLATTLEEEKAFAKIHFVNLSPITQTDQIINAIAQALGIKENATFSLNNLLLEKLSSPATLLIIDNFEQVLPAAPALASTRKKKAERRPAI